VAVAVVRDLGRALVEEAAEQDRAPARVRVGVAAPMAAGTCGTLGRPRVAQAEELGVAAPVAAVQAAPAAEGEEQVPAGVAARAVAEGLGLVDL